MIKQTKREMLFASVNEVLELTAITTTDDF